MPRTSQYLHRLSNSVKGRTVIVVLYRIRIVGVTGCGGDTGLEDTRRKQRKEMTGQWLCRARADSGRIASVIRVASKIVNSARMLDGASGFCAPAGGLELIRAGPSVNATRPRPAKKPEEFPSFSRPKPLSLRLEDGLLQHSTRARAPHSHRKKPRLGFFSDV